MEVTVNVSSLHVIDATIREQGAPNPWHISCIYRWPEENNKQHTWQLIRDMKPNQDISWLCIGDFNEILYHHEIWSIKDSSKIEAFRDAVGYCDLDDIGFEGYKFTWSNGQTEDMNIQERLDRCLANLQVEHLPRLASDHSPVYVLWSKRGQGRKGRKKIFRFEKMWLQDTSCRSRVEETWVANIQSSSPAGFKEKIKSMGMVLMGWEKECFGNVTYQIGKAKEQLRIIQTLPPTQENVSAAKKLEHKISILLQREETMWYQRSRANWIKDGDKTQPSSIEWQMVGSANSIDQVMGTKMGTKQRMVTERGYIAN
ncbi:hypothetical protein DH2020_048376 [Rehmannia glutinosa]|uniref:Endonuclease/exonuclease/phosphatase domain-containing protein n=1 Tax=Rehmannia glutinosa TaxID=99300 RepID=A0ABR0U5W0_REHGL